MKYYKRQNNFLEQQTTLTENKILAIDNSDEAESEVRKREIEMATTD